VDNPKNTQFAIVTLRVSDLVPLNAVFNNAPRLIIEQPSRDVRGRIVGF